MNEPEARKKAQEMINARSQVWCPIQGVIGVCIGEEFVCECYKMPEVYNNDFPMHDKNAYEVKHGFCTCYALKGVSD